MSSQISAACRSPLGQDGKSRRTATSSAHWPGRVAGGHRLNAHSREYRPQKKYDGALAAASAGAARGSSASSRRRPSSPTGQRRAPPRHRRPALAAATGRPARRWAAAAAQRAVFRQEVIRPGAVAVRTGRLPAHRAETGAKAHWRSVEGHASAAKVGQFGRRRWRVVRVAGAAAGVTLAGRQAAMAATGGVWPGRLAKRRGQLRQTGDVKQAGRQLTCRCWGSHGTCQSPRHRARPRRLPVNTASEQYSEIK